MSRRSFLRQTGRGAVLAGSALTLPVHPGRVRHQPGQLGCRPSAAASDAAGPLEWANWPLYIDIDDDGNYPSLVAFTEETGIEVNYTEAIQDNADFMGTILPDLQAGNPTGWDIITPGGWVIERLARLELPRGARPQQAAELDRERGRLRQGPLVRPRQQAQPVVAGRHHRHRLRPRAHRARDHDLRRPARSGVRRAWPAAFSDMRDMFGLTLLSLGVEPADATSTT